MLEWSHPPFPWFPTWYWTNTDCPTCRGFEQEVSLSQKRGSEQTFLPKIGADLEQFSLKFGAKCSDFSIRSLSILWEKQNRCIFGAHFPIAPNSEQCTDNQSWWQLWVCKYPWYLYCLGQYLKNQYEIFVAQDMNRTTLILWDLLHMKTPFVWCMHGGFKTSFMSSVCTTLEYWPLSVVLACTDSDKLVMLG